ncbi:C-terminal binding protein [Microbacterium sp. NPDC076895]|uniref:C-terminal binding protein n=1 Tax=Microbacterium sp. NPDC076895 TaxID=3154957 RepID=UPI00341B483D
MRIVVTDCDHPDIDIERRLAAEAGIEIRLEQCRTEEDVISRCADADGLLVQYAQITPRVFDALPNLQVISRYGVGVDTIDLEAAGRHNVLVKNVPDYGTEEVSDHALALLLTLSRATAQYDRSVRAGAWDAGVAQPLHRIRGRVLGVVGFGAIGRAVARKAAAFGYRVIAHDVLATPGTTAEDGTEFVRFDELLHRAHAVTLHAPHIPATHHLLNKDALLQMRPDAFVINTARGALIDTEALVEVLDTGHLAGAALDVLESEPPKPNERLIGHPRVLVTPHAAWYSEESTAALKELCVRNVLNVLDGSQ